MVLGGEGPLGHWNQDQDCTSFCPTITIVGSMPRAFEVVINCDFRTSHSAVRRLNVISILGDPYHDLVTPQEHVHHC